MLSGPAIDINAISWMVRDYVTHSINEPPHGKTNNVVSEQTGLYSNRRLLEAGNFGFRK